MIDERTFSLDELSTAAATPPRTVRYYIQLGLIDRPDGAGRGAYYTQRHLDQLLWVVASQRKGLSLDAIRELSELPAAKAGPLASPPRPPGAVEVWSRLVVEDGIEVNVEAGRAGLSPEQIRALFRGVQSLYERVKREKKP